MQKRPQHIGFSELRSIFSNLKGEDFELPFISNSFVMVHSSKVIENVLKEDVPYIVEDVRLGIVVSGNADITVNLIDFHLEEGMMMVLNYGTIIQPRRISEDFNILGMMVSPELLGAVFSGYRPKHISMESGVVNIKNDELQRNIAISMFENLWNIVNKFGYQHDIIVPAIRMYFSYLDLLAENEETKMKSRMNHNNVVFVEFIELVNKHCAKEHNIDYYAGRLFLSSHYLGSLIKQISGVTAKTWIDRALITQAKIMLKNSDDQAAQICSKLNFPNASFFSKYFKRLTGMTPQQYRES